MVQVQPKQQLPARQPQVFPKIPPVSTRQTESESGDERNMEPMVTPARRSPDMPEFITPKTESDSASDGTAETLSPWRTPLPVTSDTPVNHHHQASPEVVEEVVPTPDAGLRRSTRVRHAPQRYSPTSYYCSAVFTRPAPRPQSQLSLTQVLSLIFLALCVRMNGEVLLSSQIKACAPLLETC